MSVRTSVRCRPEVAASQFAPPFIEELGAEGKALMRYQGASIGLPLQVHVDQRYWTQITLSRKDQAESPVTTAFRWLLFQELHSQCARRIMTRTGRVLIQFEYFLVLIAGCYSSLV